MKKVLYIVLLVVAVFGATTFARANEVTLNTAYTQYPLGSIKPQGWLKETLERQRNGLTSQMDVVYEKVMGPRNGWLGGDGDQWERGPYWIDGLLPLAYILDDQELKDKAQKWIEWAFQSQQPSGQFGPVINYPKEDGLQRNRSEDWWPRMVMLKIMRQYYNATGDARVIDFLTKYFHYQLETLPDTPLGKWSFWATYRECDNMSVALWLYSKTGDEKLLDLADMLHSQGFSFIDYFEKGVGLYTPRSIHCVNLAQGFKEPVVYWQKDPQQRYLDAVFKGMKDLRKACGYPTGMYGADEALRDARPTNGIELCAVVEYMFSLEEMMRITGDTRFADMLEKVAYNALPAQITDDFMAKQYFQQVNQVMVSSGFGHDFDCKQGGTALDFGILNAFPCCLSNFHQGWPKFVQNLWLKGGENEVAVMAYGPSRLDTSFNGVEVSLTQSSCYPMLEDIRIEVGMKKRAEAVFSLTLRIPGWCKAPVVKVNGEEMVPSGSTCTIERSWKNGDTVELSFPMEVVQSRWYNGSVAVERGPLVYSLRIEEEWKWHDYPEGSQYGEGCWEVFPKSDWNYGLRKCKNADLKVKVDTLKASLPWFWDVENAPVQIAAKAMRIPWWGIYNGESGPLPMLRIIDLKDVPVETVILIPYGCTTLRVTEFPEIRN